jgi:hypothetical protein
MNDGYTPNVRIIGGLIILIVIGIVLFKVNLNQSVNSSTFKSNVSYLENTSIYVINTYIIKPLIYVWGIIYTEFEQLKGEQGSIPNPISNWQLPSVNVDINQNDQEIYQVSKPVPNQN